jgi:hypothetical protein
LGEYFRILARNVDAADLVWFVEQMHRRLPRKIILVWDRSGPYRRAAKLLLVIHPFREGNARTIKLLTDLLATQTGRPLLIYDASEEGQNRYIAAATTAFKKDYAPMAELISQALARHGEVGKTSSNPLARFVLKRRQPLDHAVDFRDGENLLDPGVVVAKPGRSLFQRRSFSEVRHTVIVPSFPIASEPRAGRPGGLPPRSRCPACRPKR